MRRSLLIGILKKHVKTFLGIIYSNFFTSKILYNSLKKNVVVVNKNGKGKTLLVIYDDRFIGEIDTILNYGDYKLINISGGLVNAINDYYLRGHKADSFNYYNNSIMPFIKRKRLRRFYRHFITHLKKDFPFDLAIQPGFNYTNTFEIVEALHQKGEKVLCLQKENLMISAPSKAAVLLKRLVSMKQFSASHYVVHNELMKEAFIKSGMCTTSQITSIGCIRMDSLFNKLRSTNQTQIVRSRPRVILFSFLPTVGLISAGISHKDRKKGFFEFFYSVHKTVLSLAETRDIDIVVKTKWDGWWTNELDSIINEVLSESRRSRVIVETYTNSHDLILNSDLIVGFGSTTLLESMITGNIPIMPVYAEVNEERKNKFVNFITEDVFLRPQSEEELRGLCQKILNKEYVKEYNETNKVKNLEIYQKYLGEFDGKNTQRLCEFIEKLVN